MAFLLLGRYDTIFTDSHAPEPPSPGERPARPLEDGTYVRAIGRTSRRCAAVRVRRWAAICDWAPALRAHPHVVHEGRRTPLLHDARPPCAAPLGMGLPRVASRIRGREGTRPVRPWRHRVHGPRQLHGGVPRAGASLRRRMGTRGHAPWTLGGFRGCLQDDGPPVHGIGHVGVPPPARARLVVRRTEGRALLHQMSDAALELRGQARRRV